MASITLSCISEGSMMPQEGLEMASDSSRLALKIIKNQWKIYNVCFCLYFSNKDVQDGIRSSSDGKKCL